MLRKVSGPGSSVQGPLRAYRPVGPEAGSRVKRPGLLILAASLLLILSFPDFNLGYLAWIALIPFFFAIKSQKPLKAFLISYLAGVLFFLGTVYWLIHVTLPGMIAVVLYLALYFAFFGLLTTYSLRLTTNLSLFSIPATWVMLEFIRSHLLTGFGWVLLGHSQAGLLPIIQIADITGAYGVSFLIVFVNTAIFLTIKNTRDGKRSAGCIALALLFVFVVTAYGIFRLNNIFTGESFRVSVIQGNIPQFKKWDSSFRQAILDKYESMTKKAAAEGVDLIIWPETSVPGFLETEPDLLARVRALVKSVKTPLLVGTPREDEKNKDAYYNSAVLFDADGQIIERHDKIHLVPFGEYVPLRSVFSFVENFAPSPIGDFAAGKNYTVFKFFMKKDITADAFRIRKTKRVRFSSLICFEDIFPELARQFVLRGAIFLVNMTNDAWFKVSSAPYQHAQSSVFRAVENRVSVIRAANTGVSCFIDQKGMVIGSVGSGRDHIFVDGYKTCEITLSEVRTFYTSYGDVFAYLCIVFALAVIFTIPTGSCRDCGMK